MANGNWSCAAVLGIVLLVGYCSSERKSGGVATSDETVGSITEEADADPVPGKSTDALDAMAPAGGETYREYDARRDALNGSAGTYEGDNCTVDCGGHSAGRAWAESHGITSEDECGGTSWSFREGCATYAREQEAEDEDAAEIAE